MHSAHSDKVEDDLQAVDRGELGHIGRFVIDLFEYHVIFFARSPIGFLICLCGNTLIKH